MPHRLGLGGHEQREQRDHDHYWYHCLVFAGAGLSPGGEKMFPSLPLTQRSGALLRESAARGVVSVA